MLFVANSAAGISQLDLTDDAVLTFVGKSAKLTMLDRDPSGNVISTRNASGHDFTIVANPYGTCDDASSTPHQISTVSYGFANVFSLCHSAGNYFVKTRSDGYDDGLNLFRGSRTFDATSMSWTSADPMSSAGGGALSQEPYAYAENNPISKSDPSGLAVYIGANPVVEVGGIATHEYLILIPDDQAAFANDPLFTKDPNNNNRLDATISGEPQQNILFDWGDLDIEFGVDSAENSDRIRVDPPAGESDTEFIQNLEDNAVNYFLQEHGPNAIPYYPGGGDADNSNALTSGLTDSARGQARGTIPHWTPGSDSPVDSSHFAGEGPVGGPVQDNSPQGNPDSFFETSRQ